MKIQSVRAQLLGALFLAANFIPVPLALAQPTNFARSLAELRAQLEAHVNQPRFSGALWGIQVASLATGKIIYEQHADRLMSPASNSKLYPGALALTTFGGDYRFATPILAHGEIVGGELKGDLIISGVGDPSWKATNFSANFAPFITVLTNAGVRRITGDVIGDNTHFHGSPYGGSWCVEDLFDTEGAEISALTLMDNVVTLRARAGNKIGVPGLVNLLLPDTGLTLVNRTRTAARDGKPKLELYREPGTKRLFVFGEMPLGAPAELLETPVPQPAQWFAAALKTELAHAGIAVSGKARSVAWPESLPWSRTDLTPLGEVKSPPLRDLLRAFMKPSQNLETDLIFAHTGEFLRATNAAEAESSAQSGLLALHQFLATNGLPASDLHFDEGSGLSRNNLTTARLTVALLTLMSTNPAAADFDRSLPIAGVDGTIRRRMKGTPAFENVHAKTGTLRWVNALSGYVTTAAGERLVFSLMLNRYDSAPDRKRTDELDEIAVRLAGFTGKTDE
jgi:D-alanyl-D-alanine carboxypeptidase/D-alanyl-D-alanine-endopeptidase (penicillin-binding protein 4)